MEFKSSHELLMHNSNHFMTTNENIFINNSYFENQINVSNQIFTSLKSLYNEFLLIMPSGEFNEFNQDQQIISTAWLDFYQMMTLFNLSFNFKMNHIQKINSEVNFLIKLFKINKSLKTNDYFEKNSSHDCGFLTDKEINELCKHSFPFCYSNTIKDLYNENNSNSNFIFNHKFNESINQGNIYKSKNHNNTINHQKNNSVFNLCNDNKCFNKQKTCSPTNQRKNENKKPQPNIFYFDEKEKNGFSTKLPNVSHIKESKNSNLSNDFKKKFISNIDEIIDKNIKNNQISTNSNKNTKLIQAKIFFKKLMKFCNRFKFKRIKKIRLNNPLSCNSLENKLKNYIISSNLIIQKIFNFNNFITRLKLKSKGFIYFIEIFQNLFNILDTEKLVIKQKKFKKLISYSDKTLKRKFIYFALLSLKNYENQIKLSEIYKQFLKIENENKNLFNSCKYLLNCSIPKPFEQNSEDNNFFNLTPNEFTKICNFIKNEKRKEKIYYRKESVKGDFSSRFNYNIQSITNKIISENSNLNENRGSFEIIYTDDKLIKNCQKEISLSISIENSRAPSERKLTYNLFDLKSSSNIKNSYLDQSFEINSADSSNNKYINYQTKDLKRFNESNKKINIYHNNKYNSNNIGNDHSNNFSQHLNNFNEFHYNHESGLHISSENIKFIETTNKNKVFFVLKEIKKQSQDRVITKGTTENLICPSSKKESNIYRKVLCRIIDFIRSHLFKLIIDNKKKYFDQNNFNGFLSKNSPGILTDVCNKYHQKLTEFSFNIKENNTCNIDGNTMNIADNIIHQLFKILNLLDEKEKQLNDRYLLNKNQDNNNNTFNNIKDEVNLNKKPFSEKIPILNRILNDENLIIYLRNKKSLKTQILNFIKNCKTENYNKLLESNHFKIKCQNQSQINQYYKSILDNTIEKMFNNKENKFTIELCDGIIFEVIRNIPQIKSFLEIKMSDLIDNLYRDSYFSKKVIQHIKDCYHYSDKKFHKYASLEENEINKIVNHFSTRKRSKNKEKARDIFRKYKEFFREMPIDKIFNEDFLNEKFKKYIKKNECFSEYMSKNQNKYDRKNCDNCNTDDNVFKEKDNENNINIKENQISKKRYNLRKHYFFNFKGNFTKLKYRKIHKKFFKQISNQIMSNKVTFRKCLLDYVTQLKKNHLYIKMFEKINTNFCKILENAQSYKKYTN